MIALRPANVLRLLLGSSTVSYLLFGSDTTHASTCTNTATPVRPDHQPLARTLTVQVTSQCARPMCSTYSSAVAPCPTSSSAVTPRTLPRAPPIRLLQYRDTDDNPRAATACAHAAAAPHVLLSAPPATTLATNDDDNSQLMSGRESSPQHNNHYHYP
ncbi:hypothetical protein RR48_01083 [Papilio machaon]|uniref:Secreted protein n=1 Tax=Papilio machaon TaxID=76193 RepID=A0A0N0PEP6_PAPMA|nr:hypothetical protein RR48_01083 [Papilio machaon]